MAQNMVKNQNEIKKLKSTITECHKNCIFSFNFLTYLTILIVKINRQNIIKTFVMRPLTLFKGPPMDTVLLLAARELGTPERHLYSN